MNNAFQRPQDAYLTNSVMTASPVKLVTLLLDGSISAIDRGCHALSAQDLATARKSFMKAWDIVAELRATLDQEAGGTIASDLFELYGFVLHGVSESKTNMDSAKALEARAILCTIRDGFHGIIHGG